MPRLNLRIHDLTLVLGPGTPVYPGDPVFRAEPLASIEVEGYRNRALFLHEHLGTHVDAPAHMIENGATVDRLPVARLVAPAVVLDYRGRGRVTASMVVEGLERHGLTLSPGHWLVLGVDEASVDTSVAELLVERGAAGLAITALTPDRPPYPVHRRLLENNTPIVEGVNLPRTLHGKCVLLVVAPLRLEQGSGAPARVYALEPLDPETRVAVCSTNLQ